MDIHLSQEREVIKTVDNKIRINVFFNKRTIKYLSRDM